MSVRQMSCFCSNHDKITCPDKKLTCADLDNPMNVRMLNDQVMQLEKIFLTPKPGLPLDFTNSTKHIILSYGVGGGFENHGKATFPGIVNLFNDLVKVNQDETPKNPNPDKWAHWEDLRRHVTEIYVMILQAASHLKPHHVI